MGRKLPPLNALRAFEAAARLKSVSKAADELSVTQSAISHQIKQLEDWAQIELLRRSGRGIALTDAGERYAEALSPALDQMDAATRRLLASDPRKGWLTVSTMPSFAAKWLVPRRFARGTPKSTCGSRPGGISATRRTSRPSPTARSTWRSSMAAANGRASRPPL